MMQNETWMVVVTIVIVSIFWNAMGLNNYQDGYSAGYAEALAGAKHKYTDRYKKDEVDVRHSEK